MEQFQEPFWEGLEKIKGAKEFFPWCKLECSFVPVTLPGED